MKRKDIAFVKGEDWCALYLDGKLVKENHSLGPEEVLDELGLSYQIIEATEYLYEAGSAPDDLQEVKADRR